MLRKSIISILLICAAAFSVTSCLEDNDYMYSGLEMVNVLSANKFKADNGNVYNVVENEVGEIPVSVRRMMISCDVLRNTNGLENEFDIRLREYAEAKTVEPVNSSEANEEELGNDVININQGWMTKGYFNALLQNIVLEGSEQEHSFNLVFDEQRSHSDTLFFQLRHNAFGDSLESEENRNKKFSFQNGYLSFPIDKYIPAGVGSIVFHFDWEWYFINDDIMTLDRVKNSGNITYQP